MNKTYKSKNDINLKELLDAYKEHMQGFSLLSLSRKYEIQKKSLETKFTLLSALSVTPDNKLYPGQKEIKNSIQNCLSEIKEKLASVSVEIINKADAKTIELLESQKNIPARDACMIADTYTKRLARLTGIEEFGENSTSNSPTTKVLDIINTIFKSKGNIINGNSTNDNIGNIGNNIINKEIIDVTVESNKINSL